MRLPCSVPPPRYVPLVMHSLQRAAILGHADKRFDLVDDGFIFLSYYCRRLVTKSSKKRSPRRSFFMISKKAINDLVRTAVGRSSYQTGCTNDVWIELRDKTRRFNGTWKYHVTSMFHFANSFFSSSVSLLFASDKNERNVFLGCWFFGCKWKTSRFVALWISTCWMSLDVREDHTEKAR